MTGEEKQNKTSNLVRPGVFDTIHGQRRTRKSPIQSLLHLGQVSSPPSKKLPQTHPICVHQKLTQKPPSFCFVCIAFVWFFIYETKGLSLEQVDELYSRVDKAWLSTKFRPEVSFLEVDALQKSGRNVSITEVADESARKKSVTHVEADGAVKEG